MQQPGIKAVAIKSEAQQAVLALHRMRAQLVKFRTAQVNGLRGLLAEYGEVMPQGRAGIRRDVPAALGRVAERLPAVVIDTLREQYARVGELDEQVQQSERRLQLWHRQDEASQRLAERRPKNVAIVALANKMARTIWALLAHEREYQPLYASRPA